MADAPSTLSASPPSITRQPKIIAYGDSLTAGFGVDSWEKSYPALLQKRLDAAGYDFQVLNYGMGGDTTEGGLARLYLATGVVNNKIFVLELGANDIMKGVPVETIRGNLSAIIDRLKEKNIDILLCGYKPSGTVDGAYALQIEQMYAELAAKNGLALMPDLMAGISSNPELMLDDKIHPNEKGVRVIEENVFKALKPLLSKYETRTK